MITDLYNVYILLQVYTVHSQLSEPLWTTSKIFCLDKLKVRISELILFLMVM